MIPSDHMSIFQSQSLPRRISGHTYRGVPQKVVRSVASWCTDHPKSHSFITFSWITRFYGLMSRWMIRLECSSATAEQTCLMIMATLGSGKEWPFLICLNSWPPIPTSMMMQMLEKSSKNPCILMMLGWFRKSWILSSRMSCSVISSSLSSFFSMTLSAKRALVFFSLTRNTLPYLPTPSSFIFSNQLMLNCSLFDFLTVLALFLSYSPLPRSMLLFLDGFICLQLASYFFLTKFACNSQSFFPSHFLSYLFTQSFIAQFLSSPFLTSHFLSSHPFLETSSGMQACSLILTGRFFLTSISLVLLRSDMSFFSNQSVQERLGNRQPLVC